MKTRLSRQRAALTAATCAAVIGVGAGVEAIAADAAGPLDNTSTSEHWQNVSDSLTFSPAAADPVPDVMPSPAQAAHHRAAIARRIARASAEKKRTARRAAAAAHAARHSTPRPASRSKVRHYSGSVKGIAQDLMSSKYGWGDNQFSCLDTLWSRESGWNVHAANPSGAYGIPQALPGSKMSSAGPDWRNNPTTQIAWGLSYIRGRYSTPCGAWGHFQSHGWY